MAIEVNGQTYYDTQPTGENNTTVNYIDPTELPEIADEIKNGVVGNVEQGIASWIRNEMGRKHVREALARSIEYFSVLFNKQKVIIDSNTAKQNNVEQRQSKLERDFITRISNATVNSEVINARQSDVYGQFNVLDLRVENIESIMSNFVPSGFIVKINHNLNKNPTVTVKKYDWAIGTETNGFDTAPEGLFGGGAIEIVPTNLIYANGVVYVHMPLVYKQSGKFILKSDTELLLIDGTHTLNFEFEGGLIDGIITDGQINDMPITHIAYAYSADGTDRFTTVYPNLNLLKNTRNLSATSTSTIWSTLFTSSQIYDSTIKSKTGVSAMNFSFSVYVPLNASVGSEISIQIKGQTYQAWGNVGTDDFNTIIAWKVYSIKQSDLGKTIRLSTPIETGSKYKTFDSALADTDSITIRQVQDISGFVYSEIKLETGSTATPWMPSSSELPTTDGPTYFGQYTDFSKVGSTNPSDYNWSSIPR